MKVVFNHYASERHQTLRCESLSVYFTPRFNILRAIELAGSTTSIRACWAEIVKGRSGRSETETTGLSIEVAGSSQNIQVSTSTRFLKRQISTNQLIVFDKRFGFTQRQLFFEGNYDNPSPYFLDALRLNITTVPFLAQWEKQLWTQAIEKRMITPLLHYGAGPDGWELVMQDKTETQWAALVKEICIK